MGDYNVKPAHKHTHTVQYEVIVVGSGHAGIEAALAAARLGCRVLVLTKTKSTIGLMPCNPSIGGPAKGQIVAEIDALGGEMGRCADETHIQLKVLNRSRGPAVQCLRSQNDKADYAAYMSQVLQNTPNLTVIESEVYGLLIENDTVLGVEDQQGITYTSRTTILTTGTFLNGLMHTGMTTKRGGRVNEFASENLSDSLRRYFKLGRLKTGTPPRLHRDSIDYSVLTPQPGDSEWLRFSFRTPYHTRYRDQVSCYLTRTTPETHQIILKNLDRSPLYTNVIQGSGPRYCPSIEDKIMRFKDKDEHHIFIEPEGRNTVEIYPQGLNTSLPTDVQDQMLRSMPGLKDVVIIRPGYAVEYDFVFPNQLYPTLQTRALSGLFLAGQINGTSGYEEAAGQGIVAGINAGLLAQGRDPFILKRENSFIGTMIDDLIHKNITEPYRMLTSRSEYRLLLRQDNAPMRLSHMAHEIGLISDDDYQLVCSQEQAIKFFLTSWSKQSCSDDLVASLKLNQRCPLAHLVKRPDVSVDTMVTELHASDQDREMIQKAMVMIKYEGYIKKQQEDIEKIKRMEDQRLPDHLAYETIPGLRQESREKFMHFKPRTIYEAKHISGINPADIYVLLTYIQKQRVLHTHE